MADDLKELKIELSKNGIFTTTLEEIYNWGRKNSVWPLTFGLACCAIEMIATTMARYDLARLIASANTRRLVNSREVRSLKSLPDFSLYMALMVPTIGRLVARSSENVLREIASSSLSPTAS